MSELVAAAEQSPGRPSSFRIEQVEGRMFRGINAFLVNDEAGRPIGHFELSWRHPIRRYPGSGREVRLRPFGTFEIQGIELDERARGHGVGENRVPGIGRELYRQIATASPLPEGFPHDGTEYHLVSGDLTTDAARGMWEGFVARGEAVRVEGEAFDYIFTQPLVANPDQGSYSETG